MPSSRASWRIRKRRRAKAPLDKEEPRTPLRGNSVNKPLVFPDVPSCPRISQEHQGVSWQLRKDVLKVCELLKEEAKPNNATYIIN